MKNGTATCTTTTNVHLTGSRSSAHPGNIPWQDCGHSAILPLHADRRHGPEPKCLPPKISRSFWSRKSRLAWTATRPRGAVHRTIKHHTGKSSFDSSARAQGKREQQCSTTSQPTIGASVRAILVVSQRYISRESGWHQLKGQRRESRRVACQR